MTDKCFIFQQGRCYGTDTCQGSHHNELTYVGYMLYYIAHGDFTHINETNENIHNNQCNVLKVINSNDYITMPSNAHYAHVIEMLNKIKYRSYGEPLLRNRLQISFNKLYELKFSTTILAMNCR